MTSPADDGNELRSASSGTTRTPPPRTRRGAPTSRPSFEDLDALDDLLEPEAAATSSTSTTKRKAGRGTRGRESSPSPAPAPGTTKAFDWDTDTRGNDRGATRGAVLSGAAAEAVVEPVAEPEPLEPPVEKRTVRTKSAKRPERRFRQTILKVDLWSVTKMALCFYVSAMGVVIVSLVALWVVADSAGIIDNLESFIGDLFSSEDFQFVSGEVLRGAVLVSIVLVALMVVFTIIAASFYNIFAELFGGVEVVIREEEQPPKR